MQYTLSEAVENDSRVRATIFEAQSDTVLEDIPTYDGGLRIRTDVGLVLVEASQLVDVELI